MQASQPRVKTIFRYWLPLSLVFLISSLIIFLLKSCIAGLQLQYPVLWIGNAILFLATLISFLLFEKSLQNNNIQYFIRVVYGGMLIKMVICLLAAGVYVFAFRQAVDKMAVLGCFGLYFIYTFVEVRQLTKIIRKQKNAKERSAA